MNDLAMTGEGGDAASYEEIEEGADGSAPESSPGNSFASGPSLDGAAIDAAIEASLDARDGGDAYDDPTLDLLGDGDTDEVEHEGRTYRVPKALKGALMRHGDYTRKTQTLAAERRALDSERAAFVQETEARGRFERDFAEQSRRHDALNQRLAAFDGVDWREMAVQDPQRTAQLWAQYEALEGERRTLREQVAFAEQQRQAIAEHQHLRAVEHCNAVLAREIQGWTQETGARLAQFGEAAFGFTPDELASVVDPRMIKVLHLAMTAHEMQRQSARARKIAERQRTAPARTLKGHSGRFAAGADTTDFAAFERLADERMRRRG